MSRGQRVSRIAHAYGNHRETLSTALAADVDEIEVDLWYRAGRIEARHERRLGWLPVLADRRRRGVPRTGWHMPLPRRHYLRLDLDPLLLPELLRTTAGEKRLLLDVKARDGSSAREFAGALAEQINDARATGWVAVCGQFWPVLDDIREIDRGIEVRYSMQSEPQWSEYARRLLAGEASPAVCMYHRMDDRERTRFLKENGVRTYCWTVDDAHTARALVQRGVEGIISNDLGLLASLGGYNLADSHPASG